jgi:hypothetical protein
LGKDETMRTLWPMILFAVVSVFSFLQWHWTGSAVALWASGAGGGLFFGTLIIEGIGWFVGEPVWLTTKPRADAQ